MSYDHWKLTDPSEDNYVTCPACRGIPSESGDEDDQCLLCDDNGEIDRPSAEAWNDLQQND